jgi:hypothetical protein
MSRENGAIILNPNLKRQMSWAFPDFSRNQNGGYPTRFLIFPKEKVKIGDSLKMFAEQKQFGVLLGPGESRRNRLFKNFLNPF